MGNRLGRLNLQLDDQARILFKREAQGKTLPDVVHSLFDAHNPDRHVEEARKRFQLPESAQPTGEQLIAAHRDTITALGILYAEPYRRRELTYQMIRDLCDTLRRERPRLAPFIVWQAYVRLEKVAGQRKDHIATSVHMGRDDFELSPFVEKGGLGKAWQLFLEGLDPLLDDLNSRLLA